MCGQVHNCVGVGVGERELEKEGEIEWECMYLCVCVSAHYTAGFVLGSIVAKQLRSICRNRIQSRAERDRERM